jgi:hypothetical protein
MAKLTTAQKLMVVGVILVAGYFLYTPFGDWVNGLMPGTGSTGGSNANPWDGKCLEHDAITMTLGPVLKRYDPGNAVDPKTSSNKVYDRVFIDGVDKGLKEDGTTLTVSFGQKVEVYYAINASDFYAAKSAFDVPCVAAFDTAGKDTAAQESKLVAYKNLTAVAFNADDSLKNTQANNQTIVANDLKALDIAISYPGVGGISPYGKAYLNFRVNGTEFDSVKLDGEGVAVATPSTYRSKANSSTNQVFYTFSVPGREGMGSAKRTYTVTFDTSAIVPAAGTTSENVTVSVDDENWYRNSDTGEMILGPADNTRADVGAFNPQLYTIFLYAG